MLSSSHTSHFRLLRVACALAGVLLTAAVGHAQTAVYVNDTTGWNTWKTSTGAVMVDPVDDQQTGQGSDDFVGNTTGVPGFQQKAGLLGGVANNDAILFRARFANFGGTVNAWGNGGNFGIGMDLDRNGSIDLIMVFKQTASGSTYIEFGQPGTGANTGPSTTTWTIPSQTTLAQTAFTGSNGGSATFYYQDATAVDGQNINGSKTPDDSWLTFGVTFAQLVTAVQTYSTLTAAQKSAFTLGYDTRISYIGFTSTQDNALNQDLFGTSGNIGQNPSTLTWAQLGAATDWSRADGTVPEPATYVQFGVLLLSGLGLMRWRRTRAFGAGR